MIHIRVDVKIVFVKGIHRMEEVEQAIAKATRRKRVTWSDWTIVGVSDDTHGLSIVTGMPFTPPDQEMEPVGFKMNNA